MAKTLIEEDFQKIVWLLQQHQSSNILSKEAVQCIWNGEIQYRSFDNDSSPGTSKEHLLKIYEMRGKMEEELRKGNSFVIGYEKLLPVFRQTKHEFVCISNVITNQGTYIIFSDYAKQDLIGILKSKRTLDEIRDRNEDMPTEYRYREYVFAKGILQV